MLLIRRFEEKGRPALRHGQDRRVLPPLYRPGSRRRRHADGLKDGDQVITGYRDHGHMLATGMDPKGVMAELTGRQGGYVQGQGRLDAHVLQGEELLRRPRHRRRAGAARHRSGFANKYRGNDNVSMAYFGDGAANQGQVYESFNMASLWKLPVVYVIENNMYAMGTSVDRASAETNSSNAASPSASPASRSTAWMCGCQGGRRARCEVCRSGKGPIHPRNEDLPLSRPLHVRPGEIPLQGRSAEDARGARSDRAGQGPSAGQGLGVRATTSRRSTSPMCASVAEAADFAQNDPEPDPSELYTDILL
jgi:pyruvate dehydrogenase E1 component alpha subunit